MKRITMTVALTFAAVSCKGVDPFIASGEIHHGLAHEFIEVGTAMNKAYDENAISWTEYSRWAEFAKRFKPAYALATKTLEVALRNRDAIEEGKAKDILIALSAELSSFLPLVIELARPRPGNIEVRP